MELELQPLNLPSDNERPFVIAGPCSAETEEQVMTTATQLAQKDAISSVQVCGNRVLNRADSRVTARWHYPG